MVFLPSLEGAGNTFVSFVFLYMNSSMELVKLLLFWGRGLYERSWEVSSQSTHLERQWLIDHIPIRGEVTVATAVKGGIFRRGLCEIADKRKDISSARSRRNGSIVALVAAQSWREVHQDDAADN